ncbi:MAG TPA: acetolactate synthase small subunit [Acidimicrobiales bacterium]|nr:acetolactate synthase small subunit [Acidimicrobiales bacterium]
MNAVATHHLLTLRVENKAGVLVRVAGLFARRGYNIFSLAVAPTDDERFSRISIVVDVESAPLQQVLDQLNKLIPVVEISELHPADAHEAELLLATVSVERAAVSDLEGRCAAVGATIAERGEGAVTVSFAASPEALDAFEAELATYPIRELQRTGRIGLPKLTAAR